VRAMVPLRQWLRRRPARAPHLPSIGVDPSSSRCFPQHNGLAVGGIRLNLIGREPHGLLATGAEADAFVRELTEDLTSILDERTGKPLVRRVMRTADLYSGDRLMNLPDLLVEWSDETPTGSIMVGNGEAASVRASSSKIGVLEGVNTYGRTGEHRPQGLYIAAGPTIRPTLLSRDVSILDFAPTFTHFLGVEGDYDGRILSEILGNGSVKPPA
jgi:predicted AlkP superfamily phosphohydrolase/phosphomutase